MNLMRELAYSTPWRALPLAATKSTSITVMLASGRARLHRTWLARLALAPGIIVHGLPVTDPAQLPALVRRHLPRVLLLDRPMLDGLPASAMYGFHSHQVRVLLLCDEVGHGLVADVLHHRLHGCLQTNCTPEVCLKAIHTVSQGELWLSRASLTRAITGATPDLARAVPAPEPCGHLGPAARTRSPLPHGTVAATLTPREVQVVKLLQVGRSNKEIARELGVMEDTVKKHLQSVFAKLGVHRRALVALRWTATA